MPDRLHPGLRRLEAVRSRFGPTTQSVRPPPRGLPSRIDRPEPHRTEAVRSVVDTPARGRQLAPRPTGKVTSCLDFFAVPRSEWTPDTLEERPYNVENAKRVFWEANERWRAQSAER